MFLLKKIKWLVAECLDVQIRANNNSNIITLVIIILLIIVIIIIHIKFTAFSMNVLKFSKGELSELDHIVKRELSLKECLEIGK